MYSFSHIFCEEYFSGTDPGKISLCRRAIPVQEAIGPMQKSLSPMGILMPANKVMDWNDILIANAFKRLTFWLTE